MFQVVSCAAQDKVSDVLSPDIDTDPGAGEWSGVEYCTLTGHIPPAFVCCCHFLHFYPDSMPAKQTGDFDLNVRPFLSSRNCIEGQKFWVQYWMILIYIHKQGAFKATWGSKGQKSCREDVLCWPSWPRHLLSHKVRGCCSAAGQFPGYCSAADRHVEPMFDCVGVYTIHWKGGFKDLCLPNRFLVFKHINRLS